MLLTAGRVTECTHSDNSYGGKAVLLLKDIEQVIL